jgi:hypothetical protein
METTGNAIVLRFANPGGGNRLTLPVWARAVVAEAHGYGHMGNFLSGPPKKQ